MMRYVVLGALVGFGAAVLLLAAFGTGGGLFPGPTPAPVPDAGPPAAHIESPDAGALGVRIEALTLPTRPILAPQLRPVLHRPKVPDYPDAGP